MEVILGFFSDDLRRSSFVSRVDEISSYEPTITNVIQIVPAFLKELIYKVLGLQVLLLEFDRFGILLGEREEGQVSVSHFDIVNRHDISNCHWEQISLVLAFVYAVLGQMAHLVTSITLNSARSCVMQSAFLTQGTVSNIPIVFSWSDSIRPEGFLSSVLLWLVIIVAVVGVGVTVGKNSTVSYYTSGLCLTAPSVPLKLLGVAAHELFELHLSCTEASLSSVFYWYCKHLPSLPACTSRISNPKASQNNLLVISYLLPLKFSNFEMVPLKFRLPIVEILLLITRPFPENLLFWSFLVLNAVKRVVEVEEDDRSRPCFLSGNNSTGERNIKD
ncbi:hypothetical protein Tco_0969717 [Tanacetum coccineum]